MILLIFVVFLSNFVLFILSSFFRNDFIESLVTTIFSVIPALFSFFLFTINDKEKKYENFNEIFENIKETLKNKIDDDSGRANDILGLMMANMEELKNYYVLSINQAKNSFF